MDIYQICKDLTSSSLSYSDQLMIYDVLRVLKTKHVGLATLCEAKNSDTASLWAYPDREHYTKLHELITPIRQSYIDFAERLANGADIEHLPGVSAAQWDLARGKAVNKEIVETYLELLQPKQSSVKLTPVVNELDLGIVLSELDCNQCTILPIQRDSEWAFAVAYPDLSIQWYDSNLEGTVPALTQNRSRAARNWHGPHHERKEDSGLFMLLGIRLFTQSLPHLSQNDALSAIRTFRPRMLAEILCGCIDPSEGDFQKTITALLETESAGHGVHQSDFSFFADAMWTIDASQDLPNTPIAESDLDFSRRRMESHESYGVESVVASGVPVAPVGERPGPQPFRILQPKPIDERRDILRLLCGAAAFSRVSRLSESSDIKLLYSYSNRQVISSEFHRRYTSVLFHNASMRAANCARSAAAASNGLLTETTIRRAQARCLVWKRLCEVSLTFGLYEFVLLCMIPEQNTNRDPPLDVVSDIQNRLLNPDSDPLWSCAIQASSLCKAIVENTLNAESLMIELYPHREHEELTNADFEMFTSIDPHVKRQIPRANR
ncbi:hypothetical protein BGZ63DRAFT_468434 [Mariannaea sp. PMI_226]|nr:hypothetical protein BGZ63DRAFT_468434 [Mariannaea sp. PMI_226]